MDFDEWDPIYRAICDAFGYDRTADERVASWFATKLHPSVSSRLVLADSAVAVVVGAALDPADFVHVKAADHVIVTGDALADLLKADIAVSLVVTDLDSDPARVCSWTRQGGLAAIHAHGDNGDLLSQWLPRMRRSNVIGTTQAEPQPPLLNFGGFTDGDRAAYLAHGLGAASISLVGWDLGDTTVEPTKRRKLAWAASLLTALERRRNERFSALDGHRLELPVDG